jgi:hypothetical protein
MDELIGTFEPTKTNLGEIGISENLKQKIHENKNDVCLGFDLIGIEDGGDFHSFHCHDMSKELIEKFGIEINEYGLINKTDKWKEMVEYMNDDETGCEPVPWYYVKIKRMKK